MGDLCRDSSIFAMSYLDTLRMLGSVGTGLGLLWISVSLIRVARSYPPPPPFVYGRFIAAILPCAVTLLCAAIRLYIDQDNKWLTALVIVALTVSTVCSWSTAITIHRHIGVLIQTNKDLDKLRRVVDRVISDDNGTTVSEGAGSAT